MGESHPARSGWGEKCSRQRDGSNVVPWGNQRELGNPGCSKRAGKQHESKLEILEIEAELDHARFCKPRKEVFF